MNKYNIKKWTVDSGQWTEKKEELTTHHSSLTTRESGMALIIVVAIIAILSSIGITFMYTMRMEEKTAFNYMNGLKASYIAKSGIEHAIAVLKSDGGDTGYDWYGENWGYDTTLNPAAILGGSEVDLDDTNVTTNGTGGNESRWIYVADDNGDTVGRYAVLITDESSKININTAGNVNAQVGADGFEINLKDFFEAGIDGLGWSLAPSTPQDQPPPSPPPPPPPPP